MSAMQLANGAIASPRSGDHSRRGANPRDVTGARLAAQRRAVDEQRAAATIDPEQVRKAVWHGGFEHGWDAGVQSVIRQLEVAGVIDPDEPADEAEDK